MSTHIRLQDVVKKYQTPAGEYPALKGINAAIQQEEFLGIVGKSGAGKSTLVNMITGADRLTSGGVWINDTAIHKLGESQLATWRGLNVGVVYQSFQLMPSMSLLQNIMLPMDFCGLYSPKESKERAMHLLDLVDIADHAYKPPSRISGGQQQRVAIARALANDPAVIVADEPTGNLDSVTAESIFQLFESLVEEGKTVVMVTHDLSLTCRFTRNLFIQDGEIIRQLDPNENYS
jgi:putative ABC transport system ATP-binding protein